MKTDAAEINSMIEMITEPSSNLDDFSPDICNERCDVRKVEICAASFKSGPAGLDEGEFFWEYTYVTLLLFLTDAGSGRPADFLFLTDTKD